MMRGFTQHHFMWKNNAEASLSGTTFISKSGAGFTIIEFIVYIAVLAILGGSISVLFLWTLQAHTKAQVLQETTSSAQFAMDRIIHEVRGAESLYLSTTTQEQVSFKTATSAPEEEVFGYIDFFLCQDALCIKKEQAPPLALTPNTVEVTNLSFIVISSDTNFPALRITMEVRHKNPNNRPELEAIVPITSTVSLR